MRSTGIGYWEKGMSKKKDIDKMLTISAELDAKRAAVYFVLYGGTDPILKSNDEKSNFLKIQEDFFGSNNISKFVSWEGQDFESRVKKPIKKNKKYELHIEKVFKINKRLIEDELVRRAIIIDQKSLNKLIGLPSVMVLPEVSRGDNPVDVLRNQPDKAHAARAIEGFLTARHYDVIVPEQQVEMNELSLAQFMMDDMSDDFSYQLALSIGSDIYLTYNVNIEDDKHNTKKATISVRAYETTTARLLGTETGYSPSSSKAPLALIESAINDGVDKVLNRIIYYWKEDLNRGIQYKITISIGDAFSTEEAEEISFAFNDIFDLVAKNGTYKENVVTAQTLDYLLWCDPQKYDKPNKLYQDIKKSFNVKEIEGSLGKVNINRKLLLLKITND